MKLRHATRVSAPPRYRGGAVGRIVERESLLEVRQGRGQPPVEQQAEAEDAMARGPRRGVPLPFGQAQQLLRDLDADTRAGAVQVVRVQPRQGGQELRELGLLAAELAGAPVGLRHLGRRPALGRR